MAADWILIANAARARVIAVEPGSEDLTQVGSYSHPAPRTCADAPDAPLVDAQARRHFARLLAGRLELAAAGGRFQRLTVVATAPFLGELQRELGPLARHLLDRVEELDLTGVALEDLPQRLEGLTEVM